MSADRYTQEQILSGIRIVWREVLGYHKPLDLERCFLDEFIPGGELEEIDFWDVIYRLERVFDFTCASNEWNALLRFPVQDLDEWKRDVAPRLTFRALVHFIHERLKPISFEPITLLGNPCLTAGIFRGLERLVGQIHPKVERFGPSTPIRACLSGLRLHRFWSRLRWMMEDQLPPAPEIAFRYWKRLRSLPYLPSLFIKLGIGVLFALWKRDLAGLVEGIAVTLSLFIPVGMIVALINEHLDPLPEGIETFGDLARVLAAIILDQQSEAASCSTP